MSEASSAAARWPERPLTRRRFAAALGLVPAALAARAAVPAGTAAQQPGPTYDAGPVVGTAVTTASLNLRSGPGTGNQVLRVVPAGAVVEITDTVAFGYRYVVYQSLGGRVLDQYLGRGEPAYDPTYATTTANVNLRAEPSLNGAVLAVIPSGTRVRLNPESSNGFRGVDYDGTNGWVRTDYLN